VLPNTGSGTPASGLPVLLMGLPVALLFLFALATGMRTPLLRRIRR
jgi:hypothetical protein